MGGRGRDDDTVGPALLCFDEFQVTDAFTAVALKGIFEVLLAEGVVIVVRPRTSQQQNAIYQLHK